VLLQVVTSYFIEGGKSDTWNPFKSKSVYFGLMNFKLMRFYCNPVLWQCVSQCSNIFDSIRMFMKSCSLTIWNIKENHSSIIKEH
jgi:hypothetical protein